MDEPAMVGGDAVKPFEVRASVSIIEDDRSTAVSLRDDVVDCTERFEVWEATHGAKGDRCLCRRQVSFSDEEGRGQSPRSARFAKPASRRGARCRDTLEGNASRGGLSDDGASGSPHHQAQ